MKTSEKRENNLSHLAIIMDGNGRWSEQKGLPREDGHKEGVESLRKLLRYIHNFKIPYLTVFSFSTDNWNRPKSEISNLMNLLRKFIQTDLTELHNNNVRIRIIGNREGVSKDIIKLIESSEFLTRNNDGLYLQIAFNYSGRDEIVNALKKIGASIKSGDIDPYNINEDIVDSNLFTAGLPEPDLLIRTGSEKRISNFLLWQLAYTEIYFEKSLWPDFNKDLLTEAINDFNNRYRRYGKIEERLKK
ncbi:polyprenyl diphosphate synthase [Hyphomicrobiales bacterium]|nr:polyprenyl diphosphate synthase [Hyphomicrobiales bacterium]